MRIFILALPIATLCALLAACGDPAGVNTSANAKPANAGSNTTASARSDPAAAQAEIKKLMDTTAAALAKNDADTMDKMYADSYTLVNIDGSVQTKAQRLASLRSGEAKYSSFSFSEPDIKISPGGDQAVVIAKIAMKGTFKGKPAEGDFRVTQVYSKTKDGWRQINAQATAITDGTAKPDDKKDDDDKKSAAPANK
jgi:ketosteroid isomerase-like protein